jgi:hypothetical protein
MNRALLKVSLGVIAGHFFDDKVKVVSVHLDTDDARHGTITLLLEGDELPPAPPDGQQYPRVTAEITVEGAHLPAPTRRIRFVRAP